MNHFATTNLDGHKIIALTVGTIAKVWEHENGRYIGGDFPTFDAAQAYAAKAAQGHTEPGSHA